MDETKNCPKCGEEMINHYETDDDRYYVCGRSCTGDSGCGYMEGDCL